MPLKIGDQAPLFKLPSTGGGQFDLSQKKSPLILYFYPKDFTPGCTTEACSFRDSFTIFKNLDVEVVGISTDTLAKHQKFKETHSLPFELLSDVSGQVCKAYKSYIPILSIAKRVTYLLDADHKIVAVYSNLLGAENHIRQMIEQAKLVNNNNLNRELT